MDGSCPRDEGTDAARRDLVGVAERDLSALVPVLPEVSWAPAEQGIWGGGEGVSGAA